MKNRLIGLFTFLIIVVLSFSALTALAQYQTQQSANVTVSSTGTAHVDQSSTVGNISIDIAGTPGATGSVSTATYSANPQPSASISSGVTLRHFVAITFNIAANKFQNANITLHYSDSDVAGMNTPYSLYKYIPGSDSYVKLTSVVDTSAKTINVTVTSPTDPLFAIGSAPVSPTATPTPTPTAAPTVSPTLRPTATPTTSPTVTPTVVPTSSPTATPIVSNVTVSTTGTSHVDQSSSAGTISIDIAGAPGATGSVSTATYTENPQPNASIPDNVALTRFVVVTFNMSSSDFRNATITISYTDADVAGMTPPYVLYKYNPDTNSYVALDAVIDTSAKTITATLTSTTDPLFAIGAAAAATPAPTVSPTETPETAISLSSWAWIFVFIEVFTGFSIVIGIYLQQRTVDNAKKAKMNQAK